MTVWQWPMLLPRLCGVPRAAEFLVWPARPERVAI